MDERDLPLIYGRAVDGEHTRHCHQIFSISEKSKLNTLHYSVFCSAKRLNPEKLFVENLHDVLADTKSLQTKQGREKAHLLFSQLMAKIKPDNNSCFIRNVPCSAITFDINFNKNMDIKGMDFRLTNAVMTKELKCKYAHGNVASESPDDDLKAWHDLIMHYKYGEAINRTLFFEDITSTTTDIIQKYMCNFAVKNNLGGIFKIPPELDENGKYPKKYRSLYGSTLKFNENIQALGCEKSRAVLPTTASRQAIDAINISSLATFNDTGENLYSQEFLQSLINYKTFRPPAGSLIAAA